MTRTRKIRTIGLSMVEAAAVKGERCPQHHELPKGTNLPALARMEERERKRLWAPPQGDE